MTIRLHDFWRSSAAYRVRIALALKGLDYERVVTDLGGGDQRSEAYLALNPQGMVPTLEIDGHVLTQSLAICDYLDAKVDANPFVPRDPFARSEVLAMATIVACDIHPVNNLRILRYLASPLGIDESARDVWYRHWVSEGLIALEAMAVGRSPYLSGDQPGLADICLVPQLYNARRYNTDLTPFPTLVAIDAALCRLSAFSKAHPDRVKP